MRRIREANTATSLADYYSLLRIDFLLHFLHALAECPRAPEKMVKFLLIYIRDRQEGVNRSIITPKDEKRGCNSSSTYARWESCNKIGYSVSRRSDEPLKWTTVARNTEYCSNRDIRLSKEGEVKRKMYLFAVLSHIR